MKHPKPCHNFAKGKCERGKDCNYAHMRTYHTIPAQDDKSEEEQRGREKERKKERRRKRTKKRSEKPAKMLLSFVSLRLMTVSLCADESRAS